MLKGDDKVIKIEFLLGTQFCQNKFAKEKDGKKPRGMQAGGALRGETTKK